MLKVFSYLKKDNRLFIKLFLSLVLCIVITVIISSSFLYFRFDEIATNQMYTHNLSSLAQTSKDVSIMTETAKTLSFQILSDLYISKLLYYSSPDVYDIGPAMTQLSSYSVSIPFIDSVYVYNPASSIFFVSTTKRSFENSRLSGSHTKTQFVDRDIVNIIDNLKDYKPFYPIPRHYAVDVPNSSNHSCYSFLCYDTLSYDSKNSSVVVVNISENWISDVMTAGGKNLSSDTFIIDGNGVLMSNSNADNILTDISRKPFIKKILEDSQSSGYLTDETDGIKSCITYTEPDSLGWRYIRVTPYYVIFSELDRMKHNLLLICSLIVLSSFILAFIVSKLLSKPIDRKLIYLKNLELENRNRNKLLKQEFLRNMLLGRESRDLNIIRNVFKEYEIELNAESDILMLLLRIDHFNEFSQKYTIEDINLYKFALGNIASELCSEMFNSETVDMGDDRIVLLLNMPQSEEEFNHTGFQALLGSIHRSSLDFMKISVSITVGPSGGGIEYAGVFYRQMLEASYHRLFYGHGSIIHSQEIMKYKGNEYTYPLQKEKLLVDAVMCGKMDTAKNIYCEIINETVRYPYTVINFVISHLSFTIYNAVNVIQKNNGMLIGSDFSTASLLLNDSETIEEVNCKFFRIFEDIKLLLEDKRSVKHENLIQGINAIINRNYMNISLCLNSIAQDLNMNPSYIGRLYKQYTLKTIPDHILEIRMEKAKELLCKTGYSICEISKKTGFTDSSYFHKTFKKENGVTPADFRKNPLTEFPASQVPM